MKLYASKFQFVMFLRLGKFYTVDYGDGRTGLYLKHFRNNFKTSLAAVGTRDEIVALLKEYGQEIS